LEGNGRLTITFHNVALIDDAADSLARFCRPTELRCRRCSGLLASSSSSSSLSSSSSSGKFKFQELPSEYWAELVDCWSCHRQEFAGIAQNLPDGLQLLPKDPGQVLYSRSSHYLLKWADELGHVLSVHDRVVQCKMCGFTLGTTVGGIVHIPTSRTLDGLSIAATLYHRILAAINAHSSFVFSVKTGMNASMVNFASMVNSSMMSPPTVNASIFTFQVCNWTAMLSNQHGYLVPALVVRALEGPEGAQEELEVPVRDDFDQFMTGLTDHPQIDGLSVIYSK
jgi:hypothetical protein